jgi:hypothetical protein
MPPLTYATAPRSKNSSAHFGYMTGEKLTWRYVQEACKGDRP